MLIKKTSPTPSATAFISLGSNLGDSAGIMRQALDLINAIGGVTVEAASSLYQTEPQGDPSQPWFINQAARLSCGENISPRQLLRRLLTVENTLGRKRDAKRRFGPRRIDLDLLLFGETTLNEPDLILPHPRLHERAFVLIPLAELAPNLILPCGTKVSALLMAIPHRLDGVKIFQ